MRLMSSTCWEGIFTTTVVRVIFFLNNYFFPSLVFLVLTCKDSNMCRQILQFTTCNSVRHHGKPFCWDRSAQFPGYSASTHFNPTAMHPFVTGGFHREIGPSQLACSRCSDLPFYCKCILHHATSPSSPDAYMGSSWLVQPKHRHNTLTPSDNVTQSFKYGKDASGALSSFLSVP